MPHNIWATSVAAASVFSNLLTRGFYQYHGMRYVISGKDNFGGTTGGQRWWPRGSDGAGCHGGTSGVFLGQGRLMATFRPIAEVRAMVEQAEAASLTCDGHAGPCLPGICLSCGATRCIARPGQRRCWCDND
jgi:hypothetical protein